MFDLDFENLPPDDLEGHTQLLERVLLGACEDDRGPDYDAAYVELRRRMLGDPVASEDRGASEKSEMAV